MQVSTDSGGSFELKVDRSVSGAMIRYEATGFVATSRHIVGKEWQQSNELDASIQMQDAGMLLISGKVLDHSDLPVANAHVQIQSRRPAYRLSGKTDHNGYFTIANVKASSLVDLSVVAGNKFQPYHSSGIAMMQDVDLVLSLSAKPVTSLNARIVGSNGMRLSNMGFLATNVTNRSGTKYGTSDGDGVLEISDINPGKFILRSLVQSPMIIINGVEVGGASSTPEDISVDVGPYVLRGQLMDANGLPVGNADLSMVHVNERGGVKATTSRTAVSRPDGTFEFGGLGSGMREILVASENSGKTTFYADPAEAVSGVLVMR